MMKIFYRIRLSLLMYGFVWLLRLVKIIDNDFSARLTQNDYSFIMSSKENDSVRFFQFRRGKIYSCSHRMPSDFALTWRDNQSGGWVMIEMILGKRKALYNAVINGVLSLEGEGKYVSLFMETMNQLNRLFHSKKRKRSGNDM